MEHEPSQDRAAAEIALILRRAYRDDLQQLQAFAHGPDRIAPATEICATAGSRLQAIIDSLPFVRFPCILAITRHLKLCEVLVLPRFFHLLGLQQLLEATGGVLDLSPPRVSIKSAADLRLVSEAVIKTRYLQRKPLKGLNIPAFCLTSLQPIEPLLPLFPTLTRLCLTHGKSSGHAVDELTVMPTEVAVAVLQHLSPGGIRHLIIDAFVHINHTPLHSLLTQFSDLQALRVGGWPLAIRLMPALQDLSLVGIPWPQNRTDPPNLNPRLRQVPALQRVHLCGTAGAVCQGYGSFTGHRKGEKVHDVSLAVPRGPRDLRLPAAARTASMTERVMCTGYPARWGGTSIQDDVYRTRGDWVASSYTHFFNYQAVREAWGGAGTSRMNTHKTQKHNQVSKHQSQQQSKQQAQWQSKQRSKQQTQRKSRQRSKPRPRQQSSGSDGDVYRVPDKLFALAFVTGRAVNEEVVAIVRKVLQKRVKHRLEECCVMAAPDVPEFSVCAFDFSVDDAAA